MAHTPQSGKYLVTFDLPETLKELIWRVAYLRRNRSSWRLLVDSFKPSTTDRARDIAIKNNTDAVIDQIELFYEAAATLDLINIAKADGSGTWQIRLARAYPRSSSPTETSTGQQTNYADAATGKLTRMQAKVPYFGAAQTATDLYTSNANSAAENIVQDVEKIQEGYRAIFNSYGVPYTENRGETCTRWAFNSRNTAFKAIALLTQEYPWLMQVVNNFDIFTNDVVSTIGKLNRVNGSVPQLYGHIESPSNETVSPRHLLTPLWSASANIPANIPTRTSDGTISPILDASGVVKQLGGLAKKGEFTIRHVTKNADGTDKLGTAQHLIKIYCEDTYEQNAWFTNKALQVTPRT